MMPTSPPLGYLCLNCTFVQSLEVYVFNDASVDEDYFGLARVPLLDLAQGQPITGTYQLFSVSATELYSYM